MSKHGLISYEHDDNAKCEICIQAKWQEALLKIPERFTNFRSCTYSNMRWVQVISDVISQELHIFWTINYY